LIGTLVGKCVVAHNKSLRSGKVVLLPEIALESIGVGITSNFQSKRDTISSRFRRIRLCHP